MIKYISNGSLQSIYIRPDDEHNSEHYSANGLWTGKQFNIIVARCIGPNRVNLSNDVVLDASEMKSLLRFFLGPDLFQS